MSKNKVFLSSNEEIEKVLTVKGMENESKSVIRFLTEKGNDSISMKNRESII